MPHTAYDALRRAYNADIAGYQRMMDAVANSRTLKEAEYYLHQATVFADSAIETLDVIGAVQTIVYGGMSLCAKHDLMIHCDCDPPF